MKNFIYFFVIAILSGSQLFAATNLKRIKYNNPDITVDLGAGLWAWPIPMDYDGDGDNDLLVVCPDKPCNCTYFFENLGGDAKIPVFLPPVKVGKAYKNVQPTYVDGKVRLLVMNTELVDYKKNGFSKTVKIYNSADIHRPEKETKLTKKFKVRANQWRYVDYDGDGVLDIIAGIEDWSDYGWDNAYDSKGNWQNGPLHGYIYLIHNSGTDVKPRYEKPEKIKAAGKAIDLYGMCSPNFADFDKDGDLDIICGEFIDKLTYFKNVGTRQKPVYAAGRFLEYNQELIKMKLQMIVPVAFDWDKDGDMDLIVGDEDGRVALVENTGKIINSMPQFLPPVYFKQKADEVKVGALVTPFSVDFDSDGDEDLVCGNTAGNIIFVENLNGANPPKWTAPKPICVNGEPIRIMAGGNGSIQGPCEEKWGYTTISVADWDGDGLLDIVANSIWGKVIYYKNIGTAKNPQFAQAVPIRVAWSDKAPKPKWNWWNPVDDELVTQWRTTPFVIDLNKDGLNDLVMLDCEGYLSFFERVKKDGELILLPGKRIFYVKTKGVATLLRLNDKAAGKSGRRKICLVDWDMDGKLDILANSKNVEFFRNVSQRDGEFIFENKGNLDDMVLAGHSTSPTVCDWNKDGVPELLLGAEDGYIYYLNHLPK